DHREDERDVGQLTVEDPADAERDDDGPDPDDEKAQSGHRTVAATTAEWNGGRFRRFDPVIVSFSVDGDDDGTGDRAENRYDVGIFVVGGAEPFEGQDGDGESEDGESDAGHRSTMSGPSTRNNPVHDLDESGAVRRRSVRESWPVRRTCHGDVVTSTTVDGTVPPGPASITTSTGSRRAAAARTAVRSGGVPDRLALVVAIGPTCAVMARTIEFAGQRTPIVVDAVGPSSRWRAAALRGPMMVRGPGQYRWIQA